MSGDSSCRRCRSTSPTAKSTSPGWRARRPQLPVESGGLLTDPAGSGPRMAVRELQAISLEAAERRLPISEVPSLATDRRALSFVLDHCEQRAHDLRRHGRTAPVPCHTWSPSRRRGATRPSAPSGGGSCRCAMRRSRSVDRQTIASGRGAKRPPLLKPGDRFLSPRSAWNVTSSCTETFTSRLFEPQARHGGRPSVGSSGRASCSGWPQALHSTPISAVTSCLRRSRGMLSGCCQPPLGLVLRVPAMGRFLFGLVARPAGARGPQTTVVRIPIVGRERLRRSKSA
jgi:hypothetical protein